jgi:GntR family transcriptional regulator
MAGGTAIDIADGLAADMRMRMLRENMSEPKASEHGVKGRFLHDCLLDMIERGFFRPGEKLPAERDMAEFLSLSLGTVQMAMRGLATSGLVERRRGAGSFVASAADLGSTVWHFRFLAPDGKTLLPHYIKVLSVEETDDEGPWTGFLEASSTIRIRRVVDISHQFTTYSVIYLDALRFRPLLDLSPEFLSQKNLRVFLHERYNAPTLRAAHRFTHATPPPEATEAIGMEEGQTALLVSALGYGFRDAPVIFQQIYVPPADYELEII